MDRFLRFEKAIKVVNCINEEILSTLD